MLREIDNLYIPIQDLVELLNLLLYSVLSKFSFRFCPPFVHENKIYFRGHFLYNAGLRSRASSIICFLCYGVSNIVGWIDIPGNPVKFLDRDGPETTYLWARLLRNLHLTLTATATSNTILPLPMALTGWVPPLLS